MASNTCLICNRISEVEIISTDSTRFRCPRCAHYILSGTASLVLARMLSAQTLDPPVISHLLRRSYENSNEPRQIFESDLMQYCNFRLPNPQEQADNLMLWMGSQQKHTEDWVTVERPRIAAIIGCAIAPPQGNEPGLQWLLSEINKTRLFDIHPTDAPHRLRFRLTMFGWTKYQELLRSDKAGMTAFMAMDFKAEDIARVVKDYFKPAALRAGFTLQILTDGQGAGLIDNQIRAAIRRARFVVADLTHDNNGAYFEAGFAEGLDIPVIYTCEASKFKDKKTHFDTNHMHTVRWDLADLDGASKDLTATIRNTLPAISRMTD